MRILFFILSLMVFRPLQAQADTVFNDTESFTVAKAIKLGRNSGSASGAGTAGFLSTGGRSSGSAVEQALKGGSTQNGGCAANKYKNGSGTCVACPTNGFCNGSDSWACKPNYWQNKTAGTCVGCTTSTTDCSGGPTYTCVGLGTWSNTGSSKWRNTSKSDPNQCVSCPNTYTECNGTDTVQCYGARVSNSRSNYSASYGYDTGNSDATKKCVQCPSNSECLGGGDAKMFCKGYHNNNWSSSNYWKDTGKAWNQKCQSCPSNGVCDGTSTYWCKGYNGTDNNWVRGTSNGWKDGATCRLCADNNYVCNGKTKRCYGTNNDGSASSTYSADKAYSPSSGSCSACPSMNECNGASKQCLGKQAGTWVDAPSGSASTAVAWNNNGTCTACPKLGKCNGTTLKCKGYGGGWVRGATNAYLSSSTACTLCPDNNYECNGESRRCYGIQNNGNPAGTMNASYAYNLSGSCKSCPGNAKCDGKDFACNDGYYKYDGASSTSCTDIATSRVTCKSGFIPYVYNSNTVYCIQPY